MPKITVQPAGKSYEYTVGKTLLEILLAEKIFVDNPCNGKGVCGKCRVKILGENIPEACETERKLLKSEELEAGIRLSCLVRPEDDLEIELLGKERKHEVLTTGYIPEFTFDCDIEKRVIEIHKPTLSDQTPWEDQIKEQLRMDNISFPALQSATFAPGQVTVVLHNGEVIQVEEGDT